MPRASKLLVEVIRPYVKLYEDPKTRIAWVEDGTTGLGHSCHPNISASGSVTGMKKKGWWGKHDRTVRSHGFIYNINHCIVTNDLDQKARDNCRCGGNHGEG